MIRVFMAMPVSDNLASDGRFRIERRAFFESFVRVVEEMGAEVMSAGTNENWGAVKLSPREFTLYDLASIAKAHCLVVVTNERLNRDMYLEIGLAAARNIPIVAVVAASTKLTYMALGLEQLGLLSVHRYDSDAEAPEALRRAMGPVLDAISRPVAV